MEQGDYLERQIEQLGKALQALVKWVTTGSLPLERSAVSQALQDRLELVDDPFNPDFLKQWLKEEVWSIENLESLAELYLSIAENEDNTLRAAALECAELSLQTLMQQTDTFTLGRAQLQERLAIQLHNHGLR